MIEQPQSDKWCIGCDTYKAAGEFAPSLRARDGKRSRCNVCWSAHCTARNDRKLARNRERYVPIKRANVWAAAECDVIVEFYPGGGANACIGKLPGRTVDAINQRACRLGVHLDDVSESRKEWALPEQPEAELHRAWQRVRLPVYEAANFGTYRIMGAVA